MESFTIEFEGAVVPGKIYRERRLGVRYYLGRSGAILRIPITYPTHQREIEIKKFKEWIASRMAKKKTLGEHFNKKEYANGDKLIIGDRVYQIFLEESDNKGNTAILKSGIIKIKLGNLSNEENRNLIIKQLLSRIVAKDNLSAITQRVHHFNNLYFKKKLGSVSLKYNLSNWGSCSSKGNINLSTCLLFARQDVIDYVIIHELAHLIEMNHSPKYWNIVSDVMPDYLEKIQWLKKNWGGCDF